MQKLIFLFCLFSGLYSHGQASNQLLRSEMQAQQTAWNKGDLTGFMEFYWKSDSLMFIGSKGITYGWQKTLERYTKNYPDKKAMGILNFDIKECKQLSASTIYMVGSWELQKDKPSGGYFTLLWKKIDGKWVIISDHTS